MHTWLYTKRSCITHTHTLTSSLHAHDDVVTTHVTTPIASGGEETVKRPRRGHDPLMTNVAKGGGEGRDVATEGVFAMNSVKASTAKSNLLAIIFSKPGCHTKPPGAVEVFISSERGRKRENKM